MSRTAVTPRPTDDTRTGRRPARGLAQPHSLVFSGPSLILFSLLFLLPNGLNLVYAFTDWSAYKEDASFVGWENFRTLLGEGDLQRDVNNTFKYAALVTVLQNAGALMLAILVRGNTRWNRILRTAFFIPVLLSPLAVGYVFQGLLAYDGTLNSLLSSLLGHEMHWPWLTDTTWTIVVLSAVHSWKWFGLSLIIYVAALNSVPGDLLEASVLDGASAVQRFRYVVWPLIAPGVTVNVTLALVGTLSSLDVVLATTGGGPARTTEVISLYLFKEFGTGNFGGATAVSLILFCLIALVEVPLLWFLRRREISL